MKDASPSTPREIIAPVIYKGSSVANINQHHTHTHDQYDTAGSFLRRAIQKQRNYEARAYTVGIGGPVGSGKSTLVLQLCKHLRDKEDIGVVTNDIFTREDWEFLTKHDALPKHRLAAVETGGCPHAAIREDVSMNLREVERLTCDEGVKLCLIESGGDNLAANFSRELADLIIYVVDVAGGDKIPRKGGPGVTQSDLLIINKIDLAEAVGASVELMLKEAKEMREGGPVMLTNSKTGDGIPEVVKFITDAYHNKQKQEHN